LIDYYLDTGLKLLSMCLCNAYSTNEQSINFVFYVFYLYDFAAFRRIKRW